MADQRSESPPATTYLCVGTDECPHVAELICYALGKALSEECRRVEAHLNKGECGYCRRWIDNATRHRTEPRPDASGKGLDLSGIFTFGRQPSPAPSELTPIPPSSRWQRQVFIDLEQRLTILEEGSGG